MATAPIANIANAASNLRLDDLLRVLLTELTHQNPFKPVENKDFMGQIAQFASLDSSQRLNQSIDQLLTLQAMNQSVGLIGRRVSARLENGTTISGVVDMLELVNGLPRLTIDSNGQLIRNVAIGQLLTVTTNRGS
ncbi:MAG TPA: flagellar hook capping FlgD N-terminal domain-containing protein [Steroidobacter sp.]